MEEQFSRTGLLLGEDALKRLQRSRVAVFGIGVFLGRTILRRLGAFCLTAVLSSAAVPLIYPILLSIGKIGGEIWKE